MAPGGRFEKFSWFQNCVDGLAMYNTRRVSANPNIESRRHVGVHANKVPRAWTENREAPCRSRAPIVTF